MIKIMWMTVLMFGVDLLFAQKSSDNLLQNGNGQYQKNNYQLAIDAYSQLLKNEPGNMDAMFNLGLAYYKQNNLKQSSGSFNAILKQSFDSVLKEKALYNLGVIAFRSKDMESSALYFEKALILDEKDVQARQDLQYVLNKLKELTANKTLPQQKKNKKPSPDITRSVLNVRNGQQLLNQVEQREKKLRDSLTTTNSSAAKKEDQDW